MATHAYTAYDAAGRQISGAIEASSPIEATRLLRERGLIVFEIEQQAVAAAPRTGRGGGRRASLQDFADFALQVSVLAKAELPIDQCLRLVSHQSAGSAVGRLAGALLADVVAGHALSRAFAEQATSAPPFIAPLLRAGEARGMLAPSLVDIARILERQVSVKRRIRGAMTYPVILLFVALLTLGVIVGVLVPTLMPMFKDTGTPPPALLRVVDSLGTLVTERAFLSLGLAGVTLFIVVWLSRRAATRRLVQAVVAALPGFGAIAVQIDIALMSRTLGTLLRNGVSLTPALPLAADTVRSDRFRSMLREAATRVQEGSRLSAALGASNVLSELPLRFIAIGEETSKLDDMLLHLADLSDGEVERRIEALLTLLTPAMTLLIGIVVGGMILSVMQAVLGINDLALR